MEEQKKKIVAKDSMDTDEIQRTMVVKELPMEPVRKIEENGITYNLITVEEYLTELANK